MRRPPSSIAKLSPPRLPKIVERQRLFKQLDRAKAFPIVWIVGPPGMGKTTLAASYIKARKLRCLWYQMDQGDADPATLFHYLGLASQKAAPRFRQPLPHLTPEYLPGLPVFTRRFFEKLFGRLKAPAITVWDNFQELPIDVQSQELLAMGFQEIPERVRVLVLSRATPPPAFARFQAEQSLLLIDTENLKLIPDETKRIIQLHKPLQKTKGAGLSASKYQEITQGWIGGLVLLLQDVEVEAPTDFEESQRVPEVLFHYLAREILNRSPYETRQLLLTSSLFPFFTHEMARDLSKISTAKMLLNQLYQSRYFIEQRPGLDQTFQYHPLFLKFLRTALSEHYSSQDIVMLTRNAGHILKQAGWIEEAVELLQAAKEYEVLIDIILSKAPEMLSQGRGKTLELWIRSLPRSLIDQTPWVKYWLGNCLLVFVPAEAQTLYEDTFHTFQEQGDREGALYAWCGYIDVTFLRFENYAVLDRWLEQFPLSDHKELEHFPSEVQSIVISSMFTLLSWRHAHNQEIEEWSLLAKKQLHRLTDVSQAVRLSMNLVNFYSLRGKLNMTQEVVRHIQVIVEFQRPFGMGLVNYYTLLQMSAFYCGDMKQVILFTEKALAIMQESGVFSGIHPLSPRVYARLVLNDSNGAEDDLYELRRISSQKHGHQRSHTHFLEAWLALSREDFEKARYHAAEAVAVLKKDGGNFFALAECKVALAQALYGLGEGAKADNQLQQAKDLAEANRSPLLQFMCLLTDAYVALAEGKLNDVKQVLHAAMKIGRTHSFTVIPFWLPKVMAQLCSAALQHNIEVKYVQNLIRLRSLVPDDPPLAIAYWPWPVKINTLGRFSITIDDRPLEWQRKAQRRSLVFLTALIALGGRDVPETKLSDALWPDAEGDKAHQAFASTLHRVRKLLKHDQAIQLHGGKVSLDLKSCWVDVFALDHLLKQAKSLEAQDNTQEACQVREQALGLYHGSFLRDEPEEPCYSRLRDRLRAVYIREITHLTTTLEDDGKIDQAIHWLEQAVNTEPLAEPLYRTLAITLRTLNREAEAQSVEEQFQNLARHTLGLEVSKPTLHLVSSLARKF